MRIAIIGSGGFGCEVYNIINDIGYECIGFIDKSVENSKLPIPIIGHEDNINNLMERFLFNQCILAIGSGEKRRCIYKVLKNNSIFFPKIIAPSLYNYSNLIDSGSIIYPGVILMSNTKIGKFTLLNSGVTLGHDVVVGDFCNINPGVNIAGGVTIGDGSFIGIGSCIRENIVLGENVIIGAGSVVINNVPDNTMVYGVPAKAHKK